MRHIASALAAGLLLGAGTVASAQELYLHYADGTVMASSEQASVNSDRIEGGEPFFVTVNARVQLLDTDQYTRLPAVSPGQDAAVGVFFKLLDWLEGPFDALVGRALTVTVFSPTAGVAHTRVHLIRDFDIGLVGLTWGLTIPDTAPIGPFNMLGIVSISGVTTAENVDYAARVIEPPGER